MLAGRQDALAVPSLCMMPECSPRSRTLSSRGYDVQCGAQTPGFCGCARLPNRSTGSVARWDQAVESCAVHAPDAPVQSPADALITAAGTPAAVDELAS